ncbi:hypothetical protein [Streptomyces sp. NPDC000351]|uniref:hypothetical protein n=1 Tax=Streptomyces sp. NPDC000351 TaxID=3154250 RepID=UPI00331B1326
MTEPAWWPKVVAAADKRRNVTGRLLAHATPYVHDGRLRLEFARPELAAAWTESGAQTALEGALAHYGWSMPVTVADWPTRRYRPRAS